MSDLVERLRCSTSNIGLVHEAAARIEALEAALRNILEARDDNQPAALNMPDLEYARSIIRIIHGHARDVLASGAK
jgi:hypothetical protein